MRTPCMTRLLRQDSSYTFSDLEVWKKCVGCGIGDAREAMTAHSCTARLAAYHQNARLCFAPTIPDIPHPLSLAERRSNEASGEVGVRKC